MIMRLRFIVPVALAAVGTAGLIVAAAVHQLRGGPSSTETPTETSTPIPPAAPGARSGQLTRDGWLPGTRYVHALSAQTLVSSDGETPAGIPKQGLAFRIEGRWTSTVLARPDGLADVQIVLLPSRVEAGSGLEGETLRQELSQPFVVRYNGRGQARAIFFPPSTRLVAMGLLRTLVSTFQFTNPEGAAPVDQWEAAELDAAGEYQASYARRGDRILRRKIRYLRVATSEGLLDASRAPSAPQLHQAGGLYTIDDAGRIRDAEMTIIATATAVATFKTTEQVSFKLLEQGLDPGLARRDPLAGLHRFEVPLGREAFAASNQQRLRNVVAGASTTDLIAAMKAARDPQEISTAQHRLSALLKLEPARAREVVAQVKAGTAPLEALPAVGAAESPEAQAAVLSYASDTTQSVDGRQVAIRSLHIVEEPTAETMAALRTMSKDQDPDIGMSASLALGSMIGQQGKLDPDSAATQLEELARRYDGGSDKERVLILSALANSGSPEALPTIEKGLSSPNQEVRVTAARALRLIEDGRADQILATILTSSSEKPLRQAALFAAGIRRFGPLAPTFQLLCAREKDASFRGEVLGVLSTYLRRDRDRSVLVLLGWIAGNDPSAKLRDQAKKILSSSSARG
jgi:hypothetical protein